METLSFGASGDGVKALQKKLRDAGFNPGKLDGEFGPATRSAVINFQKSNNLLVDGIAGPTTLSVLGMADPPPRPTVAPGVTVDKVCQMFPSSSRPGIVRHLPDVLEALVADNIDDKPMVLMALSTIRAESEGFRPISEWKSKYNTSPKGHPFDLYDNRADLGNTGAPDGDSFKGRGFIQLTGRFNYQKYSQALFGDDRLVEEPELANDSVVAARLVSRFLKDKEVRIKQALIENDLKAARRLVNGGSHGLDRFTDAFRIGERIL